MKTVQSAAAFGRIKRLEVWEPRYEMRHDPRWWVRWLGWLRHVLWVWVIGGEPIIGRCVQRRGMLPGWMGCLAGVLDFFGLKFAPINNMITNGGLRGWATFPLTGNFPILVVGTGTTKDVRYPDFTATPGMNIGTRTGNSVKITGTTDTTKFGAGDTLVYEDPAKGSYLIESRTVSGSDLQLVVKNVDGTDAGGTTASGSNFWIYRTSQTGLEMEVARAGTPPGLGVSSAAESEGSGFLAGSTDGPIISGSGASATCSRTSGAVTTVTMGTHGSNYVPFAPPAAVFKGGGAGQMIPGTVTSTPNDSGAILDGGSDYSDTPGDVKAKIGGAGKPVEFDCTVSGGVITAIDIDAAYEGFFADQYSTEGDRPEIEIEDAGGTGSGAIVELYPRRQARGVAIVDDGEVSEVLIAYAGYKLTSDPLITFVNTAYFVHEQVNVMRIEPSSIDYTEVGFSKEIAPGDNLWARAILRNPSTGAIQAVSLHPGQQFRATYQVIAAYSPTVATSVDLKIGGFSGSGKMQMEGFGLSCINANGFRGIMQAASSLLGEPGASLVSDETALTGAIPNALINNQHQIAITDSVAPHGAFGSMITRDGGNWAAKPIGAPEIEYVSGNEALYPKRIVKRAFFSVLAGNNVPSIGSICLCLTKSGVGGSSINAIGASLVMDTATVAQASGDGKPEKLNTHSLEVSVEHRLSRTLSV